MDDTEELVIVEQLKDDSCTFAAESTGPSDHRETHDTKLGTDIGWNEPLPSPRLPQSTMAVAPITSYSIPTPASVLEQASPIPGCAFCAFDACSKQKGGLHDASPNDARNRALHHRLGQGPVIAPERMHAHLSQQFSSMSGVSHLSFTGKSTHINFSSEIRLHR